MIGYCMKDEGKPWFATFKHNISDEFCARAKAAYVAIRRSYEDGFVLLTRETLFQQVLNDCMEEADFPDFLSSLTRMLNKHMHIPKHTFFFASGGKVNLNAAEGMWKLIRKLPISEAEVRDIFFNNDHSSAGRVTPGRRY